MRIAVQSDIHGNPLALDAVLEDIQAQGEMDETWVLGDLAALGYDPVGAMERLAALPRARFVRGNTDRYLFSGERPGPSSEQAMQDLNEFNRAVRLARSFGWTAGALTAGGWLAWLEQLPLEFRVQLEDGTRLRAVHASPGTDDGSGILARMTADEIRPLIAGAQADLILVGHTHIPFDKRVDGVRVVNPGSVSNPFPPDLRASYAILTTDATGCSIMFRRVEYDLEAAVEATQRVRQPSADYIIRHLRGDVQPD